MKKFGDIVRRSLKADWPTVAILPGIVAPMPPTEFGLHLWLAVPVWPLGGAKRISLTVDISAISEPIGTIFSPYGRSRRGLQPPPHRICGYRFRFGGQPPKTEFFFRSSRTRNSKILTSQFLHTGRGWCKLAASAAPVVCIDVNVCLWLVWGRRQTTLNLTVPNMYF